MDERFRLFDRNHPYPRYKPAGWDSYAVGRGADILGTESLAVCLAITFYDPLLRRGILAHVTGFDFASEEMYPDRVTDTLLLNLMGSTEMGHSRLEATLSGEGWCDEGEENSSVVREIILGYGIPIVGEDLSPGPSRMTFLHCETGKVEVYRVYISDVRGKAWNS